MPQAIPEKKRSQKNEAQRANLRLIMDYLTHVKHSHAISRNLLLIETMKGSSAATSAGRSAAGSVSGRTTKPEEFVRVYDILIQVGGNCKLLVNFASKIVPAFVHHCPSFPFPVVFVVFLFEFGRSYDEVEV